MKKRLIVVLAMLLFIASVSGPPGMHVTVEAAPAYLIQESFDSMTTGSSPSGWTLTTSGGSVTVQEVPSSSDKSMRLQKSSGSASITAKKSFASQTDNVIFEGEIMLPSKADGYQIKLSGGSTEAVRVGTNGGNLAYQNSSGSYVTLQSYNANTWYKVKIVADIAANQADIYINNSLLAINVAFKSSVTSIDNLIFNTSSMNTGILYTNNVKVHAEAELLVSAASNSSLVPSSGASTTMASNLNGDSGGATSIRFYHNENRRTGENEYPPGCATIFCNYSEWPLIFEKRDRDLGQTFKVTKNFTLESIYLRVGPNVPHANTAGAKVALQIFEVTGSPTLNNSGTPGYLGSFNRQTAPELDDYLENETYTSLTVAVGHLPTNIGQLDYMKWNLRGNKQIMLQKNKVYAFMLMFVDRDNDQQLSFYNKYYGSYKPDPNNVYVGHGIRREGAPALPSTFSTRIAQSPGTFGFPDVDTWRDLYFLVKAVPGTVTN